jgi:hypothetical protein
MADNLTEIGQLFHDLGNTTMAIKALEEALAIYVALSSAKTERVRSLLDNLNNGQFQTSKQAARRPVKHKP